jgi:hypothetical protein
LYGPLRFTTLWRSPSSGSIVKTLAYKLADNMIIKNLRGRLSGKAQGRAADGGF